jgi:hypothetical protein
MGRLGGLVPLFGTQEGSDCQLQVAVVELAQVAVLDLAAHIVDGGAVGGVELLFDRKKMGQVRGSRAHIALRLCYGRVAVRNGFQSSFSDGVEDM